MSNQYCTFRISDILFGVDVLKVQEIIRFQVLTEVPLAPVSVRGLVNLRGQIVTALDLHRRLDIQPSGQLDVEPINIVLCTEGGAVSLLVDEVGDVLTVHDEHDEPPPPTVNERTRELLTKVCKLEDELLLVLDADRTVDLGGHP
ncbi:MAG: chemotaxis protein CheW [Planctomycetota bacterium]|nr:chemotaxis protein CheW [Planctomycetota bacterium]